MGTVSLRRVEIVAYLLIWVGAVGYSLYRVHLFGNYLETLATEDDGFSKGWAFTGRAKDETERAWSAWKDFIAMAAPWMCVHFVVAEIIRYSCFELLNQWYILMSVVFTTMYFGVVPAMLLLVLPCFFFIVLKLRCRTVLWMASLIVHGALSFENVGGLVKPPFKQQFLVFVALNWTHLRCLSFCLDELAESRRERYDALLGYTSFLPLLYTGPVVLYASYQEGLTAPFRRWTLERILRLVFDIGRFVCWICVAELGLHYVYVNALPQHTIVVSRMGRWQLYGLGYAMAQFFHLKYTVTFGGGSMVARAHHVPAPAHPKCIGRQHRTSEIWKHFDRGLYLFLVNHVYVPCLGERPHPVRKIAASLACFVFVCVWHRARPEILVWCALNFIGIAIECCTVVVLATPRGKALEMQLGPRNMRRLQALGGSVMYVLACTSHFYFFGGAGVGNAFVRQLKRDVSMNLYVVFFFYCFSQVSIEIQRWEEQGRKCPRKSS